MRVEAAPPIMSRRCRSMACGARSSRICTFGHGMRQPSRHGDATRPAVQHAACAGTAPTAGQCC
eukprot:scaffold99086_cov69-Phaeocystis_antarctica.AAC.1